MTRVFKTLLLWLLMAALPAQGQAAAMKASCGPGHHASSVPAAAMAQPHAHEAARDSSHHPDAAAHSPADVSVSGATAGTDAAGHGMHKSSYCSACAACCVGAVAPPSVELRIPAHRDAETVVISPPSLVAGHVPAGPERPPRQISL